MSYLWYKRLIDFFLEKLELMKINTDHSIFMNKIYLDDFVISTIIDNIKIIAQKYSKKIKYIK